uniref:Exonuclease domain-containing protein n=1 Tax=Pseudonaja textilis TaxID=8673 RepID=A0A670YN97_PSETE
SAGTRRLMVAIDCEMVGTGPGGRNSDLARCSVVGYYGDVMYDKYIRPLSPITNYRTRWSGIRQHHMRDAVPFKLAQKEVRGRRNLLALLQCPCRGAFWSRALWASSWRPGARRVRTSFLLCLLPDS